LRGFMLMIGGFHCLYSSLKMGQWVGTVIADRYQSRQARYVDILPAPADAELAEGKLAVAAPVVMWTLQNAVAYWTILTTLWLVVFTQASIKTSDGQSNFTLEDPSQGKFGVVLQAGMCFAPLGAWLRFQLSKYNPRCPTFPAFTFAANLMGTLISVLLWIIAQEIDIDFGQALFARADVWVSAISGGLCGCLSTASTFANELDKLARGASNKPSVNALIYGATSLFAAQFVLCIAINAYLV